MKAPKKPTIKSYPKSVKNISVVEEPAVLYGVVSSSMDQRTMMMLDNHLGDKFIGLETDLISIIREGVSKKSLDHLIKKIGYSITEIADVLHVSDRNLRRYEPKEKLNTEQSERLIEIAKLYTRGEDVFGSIDVFNQWMNAEILAFGNKTPKSFLDTSLGIQLLMKELGRIEQGVFA